MFRKSPEQIMTENRLVPDLGLQPELFGLSVMIGHRPSTGPEGDVCKSPFLVTEIFDASQQAGRLEAPNESELWVGLTCAGWPKCFEGSQMRLTEFEELRRQQHPTT